EVLGLERRWRRWPEVHHLGATLASPMNHGLTDAAQPTIPWLDGGEGERRGDRGINGVTPGIEHGYAGRGGVLALRNHHAAPARGRRLRELPILRAMRSWCKIHGGGHQQISETS